MTDLKKQRECEREREHTERGKRGTIKKRERETERGREEERERTLKGERE